MEFPLGLSLGAWKDVSAHKQSWNFLAFKRKIVIKMKWTLAHPFMPTLPSFERLGPLTPYILSVFQHWELLFPWCNFFFFLHILFIYFQREGEGERHGKKRQCVRNTLISRLSLTPPGDLDPGMCPDWETNRWPFGLQASTQSTEPHQPGQIHMS